MSRPRHEDGSLGTCAATGLGSVLALVFLASLGTGVFWNAIGFIAKHGYGFSQPRTLTLYFSMGLVYTGGALAAGSITRGCERWIRPRTLLVVLLLAQAVLCLGPIVVEAEWALWGTVLVVSFCSSIQWPLAEAYVTAGRHGRAMRLAIGWFNLVWMTAVALPLFVMPPILEHHAEWAIGGLVVANLAALIPLVRFQPRPGHHDRDLAGAHVQPEYGLLLRSARVLLAMSYVLNAALSPLLPYLFAGIGANVKHETPATATWMIVRVLVVLVMWRASFWHGRWGTLLSAGCAMTVGFAVVVLSPTMAGMLLGFVLFGAGLGAGYYAALYYGMTVGHAEVEAGGRHEATIGAGYTVGPAAGLAGTALGGGAVIVGIVWGIIGLGGVGAVRPYLAARKLRRGATETDERG